MFQKWCLEIWLQKEIPIKHQFEGIYIVTTNSKYECLPGIGFWESWKKVLEGDKLESYCFSFGFPSH